MLAAQKANHILGCRKSSMISSSRALPSLYSALRRPHLEYCVQLWGPLERHRPGAVGPEEATEMIREQEHLYYEVPMRKGWSFSD